MRKEDLLEQAIGEKFGNPNRFAAETGIPYMTIRNILKRGIDRSGVQTMIQVTRALGIDLDALYDGELKNTPDQKKEKVWVNRGTGERMTLSIEAENLARRWQALDDHGQTTVQVVLTEEEKRMAALEAAHRPILPAEDEPAKVIPLYFTPSAAGYASPDFGEDFDYIEVGGDVPPFADFAVKIDGDSMEPYIMDGSTVYVNRDPLISGDVGIFYLDGDMLCKQYIREADGGVRLVSLNRARADADRYIPADSELRLVCHGRVIMPKIR